MNPDEAVEKIRQLLLMNGGRIVVPQQQGNPFTATLSKEAKQEGVNVTNLGVKPFLPWEVFKETIRLLHEESGEAARGDAMGSVLGEKKLQFNSVEGRVAKEVYNYQKGERVFRRISPITNLLVLSGICNHGIGTLKLKSDSMNKFIKEFEKIWANNPSSLLDEYKYQPNLTKKLDGISSDKIDRQLIYEMVLWKINRFPEINDDLINEINTISGLQRNQHNCEKSRSIIEKLLRCRGVRLPMASTILRFTNPNAFQIIDDRVCRVLSLEKKYPAKPAQITQGYLDSSIKCYFEYLDQLNKICCDRLPFDQADKILYQLDIALGNKIGD